jgi:hypothetical protein
MVTTRQTMTRLDRFLAYSESHRSTVCLLAAVLVGAIAWWIG